MLISTGKKNAEAIQKTAGLSPGSFMRKPSISESGRPSGKRPFRYGKAFRYSFTEAGQRGDLRSGHGISVSVKCVQLKGCSVAGGDAADMDLKDTGLIAAGYFDKADVSFALIIFIFI